MGVGPGRVATNCIVRKQVLHKQERERLLDDDYAVENESPIKLGKNLCPGPEVRITLRVGGRY